MHIARTTFVLSVLCLASCFGPPAGKGRRAETGYHAAAPVITALQRFRRDHGHYPTTLQQLVPRYVPDVAAFDLRRGREHIYPDVGRGFGYRRHDGAYTLSFEYSGPGMNKCRYDSRKGEWEAHGYY